jgi:zinc protease
MTAGPGRALALPLALALVSCHHHPGNQPAPEPPDEPFRQMQPPAGTPRPFQSPQVQRFTLGNGADVILVERHGLPMVTWYLVFPAGSINDPPGKEGLARLCTGLLVQGQGDTADLLADFGSSIYVSSDVDQVYLQGFSLRRSLDSTLDLWARILTMPGMTAAELEYLRGQDVADLAQARATPASVAHRLLSVAHFGPSHPYSRWPSEASYRAVTVDDCVQFRNSYLHGNGARLLVAGDITRAEVEQKFSTRLMDAGQPVALPALPPSAPDPTRVLFSDVPGATQSIVYLWTPGPTRQDPAYYPATVMAAIFAGDSAASRLGADLRESMGSTYSVQGGFAFTRTEGTLVVSTPVRTDATATAISEIVKVAAGMRDSEATADELARSRDGRISALPTSFVAAVDTLFQFDDLVYYGMPFTFYDDYARNFGAVDAAAVRGAAQDHLAADQLHFIVVGDGAAVLPSLRALTTTGALAGSSLRVVDADGLPGP